MSSSDSPTPKTSLPPTKPTGQKRSQERGSATRSKKNPGKRAKQGG